MNALIVLALGQLVSLVGTGMVRVAMSIWIWQTTEWGTAVAGFWFFVTAPLVIVSPLAGTLVDRWNRKKVMIGADLVAGLATVAVLALYATDSLQLWQLYLAVAVANVAESFQSPAQLASVTLMVPREQHTQANGLISMAQFGSAVLGPVLAGLLIAPIGISGILIIDLATFLVAVGSLLLLFIPQPPPSREGAARGSLWQDTKAGIDYVVARAPILHVVFVFTAGNFLFGFFGGLFNPMVLARTQENAKILGLVLTIMGVGGVCGGLLLSLVKTRRRIHGVLLGVAGFSLLGSAIVGIGQSVYPWAVGAFFAAFFVAVMNGCVMAIGQAKIPPDVQGRIFGLLRTVAQVSFPLALLIVGPLADHVFEPGMTAGGALVPIFSRIVGTGQGAGMSLLILLSGLLGAAVAGVGYLVRTIRDIEVILPDQIPSEEETDAETEGEQPEASAETP